MSNRRYIHRRTHLDPCSEPPLSVYQESFFSKYGITILAFCTATLLTSMARNNGFTPNPFQNNIEVIKSEKTNVLEAIAQVEKTKKEIDDIVYQINYMFMFIKETDCKTRQQQDDKGNTEVRPNKENQRTAVLEVDNVNSEQEQDQKQKQEKRECEKKCPVEETAAIIDKKVQEALEKYDADKTGMADYALESAGGMILSTGNTIDYSEDDKITLFGLTLCSKGKGPEMIINPSMQPGNCWAFKGENGYVVIQLAAFVQVTGVTMEHIPKAMAPSQQVTSAPREFSLYGMHEPNEEDGKPHSVYFGRFLYDIDSTPIQYYPIDTCKCAVEVVEIHFHNNHGNRNYTCVYRVRVHGIVEE